MPKTAGFGPDQSQGPGLHPCFLCGRQGPTHLTITCCLSQCTLMGSQIGRLEHRHSNQQIQASQVQLNHFTRTSTLQFDPFPKDLLTYFKGRQEPSIYWLTIPWPTAARSELGQSQELDFQMNLPVLVREQETGLKWSI